MYIFFDTETTGLPMDWSAPVSDLSNWPRLVQIAWIQFDRSGKQVSCSDRIVRPQGFSIPPDAARIHGITTERAMKEGVPLKKVLFEFSGAIEDSSMLVAHNMSFDEKVVGAEFLREDISNALFQKPRLCTKEASTEYCRLPGSYGYKWPTLAELYTILFQKGFEDSHSASGDVRACADCFFELKRLGVVEGLDG
ncbi:MAG: 3'-5' exonuclease [Candidatus Krumholzibacteria bacterium]|nr:3'-5' exonuclease [Candidatus Krumholzibacteria bacterium]